MNQDIINKIKRKVFSKIFFDVGDYRKTVFLAGTGRSGTTWVQDIINSKNDHRVIFEPFNSRQVSLLKDWNYRQYLQENNNDNNFFIPAKLILSGTIRSKEIDKYNQKLYCQKRIIKDIRTNLILHWIKHNFPEIPIILLLRHPCAVAYSKMKLGWGNPLNSFIEQEELVNDFLYPFIKQLKKADNSFDKHIFTWCVENYIPLKQFNENEILIIFYEHLFINPEKEIQKLMRFLGNNFSSKMVEQSKKPSLLSQKESAILLGKTNIIDSWRQGITEQQITRAVDILSLFGLDKIYNYSNLPLSSEGKQALKIMS